MNIEVRYFSKTGNTEKLAKALAQSLNVKAKTIDEPLNGPIDILFLGNSVYSSTVAKEVKKFIRNIDVPIENVVNFGSAATNKTTTKKIKKLFRNKNSQVLDQDFFTKGRYKVCSRGITSVINNNLPDDKDLKDIAEFGRSIVDQFS